jgi:hypothetical protein
MTEDAAREEFPALPDEVEKAMQDFADKRGRAAVFLILPDLIKLDHVKRLRSELRDKEFKELDLVIHSEGGDIHAAYLISALVRLHMDKDEGEVNACIPLQAKSAATLLCLGADKIVLDEIAQLGPLDTQIKDDQTTGADVEGYTSALHPFKALEQLQEFSLTTLTTTTQALYERARLNVDDSIRHALSFVGKTTTPLYSQLEVQKFGIYSRALSVGEEYGKRILKRVHGWEEGQAQATIHRIIHDYPSHHYIIDFYELEGMKLDAELFPDDQRDVVDGVFAILDSPQSIVKCVEPTKHETSRHRRHETTNGHEPVIESEPA